MTSDERVILGRYQAHEPIPQQEGWWQLGKHSLHYVSPAEWDGVTVWVSGDHPCPVPGHDLDVLRHYVNDPSNPFDEDDWLYTGLLRCPECEGHAEDPTDEGRADGDD